MANEGDLGNEAAEFFLSLAHEERNRRNQKYYYTGLCWNCSEPLKEGAFCQEGGFCREDYEKRERMRG